jgi:hypothetical protein
MPARRLTKKLLSSNLYAVLPEEGIQKKEKMPPFYVKGDSSKVIPELARLSGSGLKAEYRLCSDGLKIIVPSSFDYKAVEGYLKVMKLEYFSHDVASEKPFKVVLRGLMDMDINELKEVLEEIKLRPEAIFKMRRHNKNAVHRDQLYLIHLVKGSINMKELKNIRALRSIIVEWERYTPVHRDITQCRNCLLPGHGSKHCHMKSRCGKCGSDHQTADCTEDEIKVPCLNCGQQHVTTSRTCPKRTEFIEFRKKVAQRNQPKPKRDPVIFNEDSFPVLAGQSILASPLLSQQGKPTAQQTWPRNHPPPGFRTYAQTTAAPPDDTPYSMEQLAFLFSELDRQTRACTTNNQQVAVMMRFYFQHRSILTQNA